jgi:hypothetical protein
MLGPGRLRGHRMRVIVLCEQWRVHLYVDMPPARLHRVNLTSSHGPCTINPYHKAQVHLDRGTTHCAACPGVNNATAVVCTNATDSMAVACAAGFFVSAGTCARMTKY